MSEQIQKLNEEIARLKRGDFTPEEFQNLCHHRDEKPGCTRAEFEEGCRKYQRQLFGKWQEVHVTVRGNVLLNAIRSMESSAKILRHCVSESDKSERLPDQLWGEFLNRELAKIDMSIRILKEECGDPATWGW